MARNEEGPRRGPEPKRLKLTGPWEEAVKTALRSPPMPKPARKANPKKKGRGK